MKDNIKEIDLDQEAWKQIKRTVGELKSLPEGYTMNDWVYDICETLKEKWG